MKEFDEILALEEKPEALAKKYNKIVLENLMLEAEILDKKNKKEFEKLINGERESVSLSELNGVWEDKGKIFRIKEIIRIAILSLEKNEFKKDNQLILLNTNKVQSSSEKIIIEEIQLKPIHEEINLGLNDSSVQQFLYNSNQVGIKVSNSISFEIEMFFEPLAQVPLRLQHTKNRLDKEIEFNINF